ncbi:MAG TPA: hypothetical protein VF212_17995 [Longimicrobiales bacterium]
MQAWWERDQIISAFIVGSFSMTAALISMIVNTRRIEKAATKAAEAVSGRKAASAGTPARRRARRARRMRSLGVGAMFVAGMVLGGVGYRYGATALSAAGMAFGLPFDLGWRTAPTLPPLIAAEPTRRVTSSGGSAEAAEAVPAAVAAGLPDWLRTLGRRIYYRYAERLPDACAGTATAHGNWEGGDAGVPVRCVDSAWLVFDVSGLVEAGTIAPGVVYCVNFRDGAGRWAAHDAANSPGVERVAVPSPTGAVGPMPLGFRVVPTGGADRVEFASAATRAPC